MKEEYFSINVRSDRPGGDIKIIDLEGELDITTLSALRDMFDDLYENKYYQLIINFSNVKYIDSTIFGLLVNKLKISRHNFGDIKIFGLNEQLMRIFKVLGGLKIYKIYENEKKAVEAFKE
ncbi:MAG: STAS domain-containing protein [Candidatus Hydrogenedentota bacterium]